MKIGIAAIVSLIGCLVFSTRLFSQSTNYDNAAPPVVIPPSPAAAALFHDIDVPIDYYTGVQKLSIPLYTIKLGSLQVPINLHYRATGIKVEEDAGWTGLGWDLDAGGAVGRSIIGWPDEDLNIGYRRTAQFLGMPAPGDLNAVDAWFTNFSEDTCDQYNLSLGKTMEMTPDDYFINICGNSARLFFDQNAQPYLSPYKPWKITGNEAAGYTVVTDDGTIYVLQLAENSTNTVETLPTDDHSTPVTGNTSWYLTQIISANKTDTINLSYKAVSYTVPTYIPTESMSLPWTTATSPCGVGTPSGDHTWTYVTHAVTGYVISNISTRNQRVDFISSESRIDIPDSTKGLPYKLDGINVYFTSAGSPDVLLKSFLFNYDYYNSGDSASMQRLRLLSMTESDPTGNLVENYSFTYHDSVLPAKTSMAQDLWGYYNGKDGNSTMIPSFTGNNGQIVTLADRSVDTTKAGLGLLTSIRYPTGGTTSFEYESNRWGQSTSTDASTQQTAHTSTEGGGATNFDSENFTIDSAQYVTLLWTNQEPQAKVGDAIVKLINTGNSTTVFGNAVIGSNQTETIFLQVGSYQLTATRESSDEYASIRATWQITIPNPYVGNPIGGARIKRMVQFDGTDSTIKRFTYLLNDSVSSGNSLGNSIYSSFEYVPQICDAGGASYKAGEWTMYAQHSTSVTALGTVHGGTVAYTKVTVLSGDNGENGSEEYDYNFVNDIGGGGYPYAPPASFDDVRGLLVRKVLYRSDGTLVQEIDNSYSYNTNQGDPNFRSIYGVKSGTLHRSIEFGTGGCPAGPGWGFSSRLYQQDQFWPTLYSTSRTDYSSTGNNSITTTSYFTYDQQNTQVNKKVVITSKLDSVLTYTTFADGIQGNSVYTEMINRNMISVPIESDEYRDNTFLAKRVTNYSFFPSGANQMLLPSTVQLQRIPGPLETRLLFDRYDQRGNTVTENKSADAFHTYVYDYQNIYPVAEIVNADSGDVAYTSFEADGTGNWSINGGSVDNTHSITGRNSYQSGTITKFGLNPATTYIVSYWSQNGAYSIPGTISGYPQQGKTVSYHNPAWTLYVHKVTGQSAITVNATGHIDELRLYPATAQMTTYTYDPLVGMTTQMDAGSRATYYEYDGLQRLKRVRDQDYNILKTIEYAYQTPAGCGGNCYTVAMQTFAGTNTLSYPVGVFDVNGNLVGNASNAAGYVSLWNSDTADARVGALSQGSDSLHFNLAVNAGQTPPAGVTGCRYYQFDLNWNIIDGIRNFNSAYVDFGDGTGMHLGKNNMDPPKVIAPNTTYAIGGYHDFSNNIFLSQIYFIHTYSDTTLKTLTFYHNDDTTNSDLDNINSPATSLNRLTNLRGNLPQNTLWLGGSSYEQPGAMSVAGITNWNTITNVLRFNLQTGDFGDSYPNHVAYTQDFMKNNKGLQYITIAQCIDTGFKVSRLKSDWNTYFTQLFALSITDAQWSRENLSALTNLWSFGFSSTSTNGAGVIDSIINQIATGAGHYRTNGVITITWPGYDRTAASADGYTYLKSRNWIVYINGVYE